MRRAPKSATAFSAAAVSAAVRSLIPAVAVLAGVLLSGCVRDPDPIAIDEGAVAVHAVLEAGSSAAVVVIGRADLSPVSDAEVRIIHGADTTWAIEDPYTGFCVRDFGPDPDPETRGCYRGTLPAPVQPGGTYELEIRLPNGGLVTGETRVAEAPAITTPEPLQRVMVNCADETTCYPRSLPEPPYLEPVATFPIAWERPAETGGLDVRVIARNVYFDGVDRGSACNLGFSSNTTVRLAPDSLRWGVTGIVCSNDLEPARFDSIRAEVVVTVLNETYADYLDAVGEGSSVREEAVSRGIDGAYGVFGAVSPAGRSIMLVRVENQPVTGPIEP